MPIRSPFTDIFIYFWPLILVIAVIIIYSLGKRKIAVLTTTDLNSFFSELSKLNRFLFFKPYPLKTPTKTAEMNLIRLDNSDANQYSLWWGDNKNEQEKVLERIKSHINNVKNTCIKCKDRKAVAGYYNSKQLYYPDDVAFDKVVTPPINLCFSCFKSEVQPLLTNSRNYLSIEYQVPNNVNGDYLFYFIDFGSH